MKHLYAFMDNEIERSLHIVVKKHLDECGKCSQKYKSEKQIRVRIKALCKNIEVPARLYKRISEGLDAIDKEFSTGKVLCKKEVFSPIVSLRAYAVAASILLSIIGGIMYYANFNDYDHDRSFSIVNSAVENHVVAVHDNLVFNEKTSVVKTGNKYFENVINAGGKKMSSPLNIEQVRVMKQMPVNFCGENSSCVVFDMGNNKLSLQTVQKRDFPIERLEKVRFGSKLFYMGNSRGFNSVLWKENGALYCLTSDINKKEMLQLAAVLSSR
ncbi:MAG: hypothetical protein MRJ65_01995 [Candidatus Brocadiaceae bacterium]|nr:hypothetical protein [Candidatus Brocadiaceae bacterium]